MTEVEPGSVTTAFDHGLVGTKGWVKAELCGRSLAIFIGGRGFLPLVRKRTVSNFADRCVDPCRKA